MPLEVAAKKIGVSAARLADFESGEQSPSISQLRKIARVFRKPTAFFYLDSLPERPETPRDFRRLPDTEPELTPELRDAFVRASVRRADALELARLVDHPIDVFDVSAYPSEDTSAVAERIRARLAVSLDEQFGWRDQYEALRQWTGAVEAAGLLVSQFSDVEVAEARGFSIAEQPYALVAINGKDSPRAKVFTLFHEVVHIVLGSAGVCDLHDSGSDSATTIERYCNRVAAEVLVPKEALLDSPIVSERRSQEWDDDTLRALASHFSVSQEVILRRLLTLGRTTQAFYSAWRNSADSFEVAPSGGFLPHFRRVLRDNGPTFTGLVLEAYYNSAISSLDLSRLLGGIKLRSVPDIEAALARRQQ